MISQGKNENRFSVVLLYSVSGVLRAEKLFKAENVSIKVIPVPRHLSSDCGICVRFEREDQPKIEDILARNNLEIQGIYSI